MVFTMSDATRHCLVDEYGMPRRGWPQVRAGRNAAGANGDQPGRDRYSSQRILFVGAQWERKGGPELAAAFEGVLSPIQAPRSRSSAPRPSSSFRTARSSAACLSTRSTLLQPGVVFCMPTRREAYGIVFLEALAHALPVVATKLEPIRELVSDGETGYLVDVGDIDALAARLTTLLDDPERCRRFGEAARRAGESYSWERTAETVLRHIEKAVGPL